MTLIMATVNDVVTYARQLAQTDSNGITDTLGLAFSNDALQNITREMFKRDIDAAQVQEAYTNLTTNNPNTYAWPTDMFALKTIEVNTTSTNQQDYLQARSIEVANIQYSSFDWLRVNQSSAQPLFDNRGDTFEIFPIPGAAVTRGIKIIYFLQPTEFTSGSDTINYPQSLDYRCLSARVACLYAKTQNNLPLAQIMEKEYQDRLQDIIRILAPASQQPIQPERLQITGWQF